MDQISEDNRPRKRLRVPVACRSCRVRKSRCDGGRPSCQRCATLGDTCLYEQPSRSSVGSVRSDSSLFHRLNVLEQKLESASFASTSDRLPSGRTPTQAKDLHRSSSNTESSPPEAGILSSSTPPDSVDGMGTIRLADDGEDEAYFGPTSNIALLQRVSRASAFLPGLRASMDTRKRPPRHVSQSLDSEHQPQSTGHQFWPLNSQLTTVDPVPDAVSIATIHEYFSTVGLCLPILHEDSFIATYEQARRDGFRNVRRSWLALLYMVLAMVKQSSNAVSPCDNAAEISERYFRRAMSLAVPEAIIGASLEIVQLLCSMCAYLQGSSNSSQVWTFHSLAVKAAIQIGLHSGHAPSKSSPLQYEMRRRAWYCCVIQDALLSVTFGCPPLISSSTLKRYSPFEVKNVLPPASRTHAAMSASLSSYQALISLSDIVHDILSRLYSDNSGSPKTLSLTEILGLGFSLSCRLSEWCDAVALNLRPGNAFEKRFDSSPNMDSRRLRNLLAFRYFSTQILVYRPLLFRFLEFDVEDPHAERDLALLKGAGVLYLKESLDMCCQVICLGKLIVDESANETDLWGAWWYTTYYTFNASLTLFGALLVSKRPQLEGLFLSESVMIWRSHLEDAVGVLARVGNGLNMITRCHDCIKGLIDLYDRSSVCSESIGTQPDMAQLDLPSPWPGMLTQWSELQTSLSDGGFLSESQDCLPGIEPSASALGAFLAGSDLTSLNGL